MHLARFCNTLTLCVFFFSVQAGAASIELKGSTHDDHRKTPKLEFPGDSAVNVKSAADYLKARSGAFKIPADLSNLELVRVRHSLIGIHSRYRQVLNGLPIEGAEVVVSQRKSDGKVYQAYNNTYPVEQPMPAAKNTLDRNTALQKAWDHLHVYGKLRAAPKADLMYVPAKAGFAEQLGQRSGGDTRLMRCRATWCLCAGMKSAKNTGLMKCLTSRCTRGLPRL